MARRHGVPPVEAEVSTSFEVLTDRLRRFAADRDWDQFHDPKNLVMALASEIGELAAEYRWVPNAKADEYSRIETSRARISSEIGDVGILLLLLCERTQIDLFEAIKEKIELNEAKYPVGEMRGKADAPR